MKEMSASEFKARCLAVLDEVQRTGEPLTITKRGRPVAEVVPALARGAARPQDRVRGRGRILGDVVGPVLPAEAWTVHGSRRRP